MKIIASEKKHPLINNIDENTKCTTNKEKANQEEVEERNKYFVPYWSVLRARVIYVDANLVYQYDDSIKDLNIMLAFTTAFLSATFSFLIAFISSQTFFQSILFGTSTAFSILFTVIFLLLTIRTKRKVNKTRKSLFHKNSDKSKDNYHERTARI